MDMGENKSQNLSHMETKNASDGLEDINIENVPDISQQNDANCVIPDKNSDLNTLNSEHSNNNCQIVKFSELQIHEAGDSDKVSDSEEKVSNTCDLIEHLKALQDAEEFSKKVQKLEEKCRKLEQHNLDLEIKLESVE